MAIRNYMFLFVGIILMLATCLMTVFRKPVTSWQRRVLKGFCVTGGTVLILAVILFPDLSSVKTTGPFLFDSAVLQVDDESRPEMYSDNESCRKLSVLVYYPTGAAIEANSCPLVVFSHGGISMKTSNISLFEELASHGYVVISIDHTYQALYTTIDGERIWADRRFVEALNNEDSHKDIANSYECYQEWMDIRTNDINFVIDKFLEEAKAPDNGFYSLIDIQKIGLAGHSLGGAAVLGVARQRENIAAVVVLEAPYMCDITGYEGDQFTWNTAPYNCAVMNIYSDTGYQLVGSDNKYAQNKKYLLNRDKTEYDYIEGSNHFTLTDLVRNSPLLCHVLGGGYTKSGYETLKVINEKSLAFYDQYLMGGAVQ